ncbi:TonB-dependent receptor [Gemmatirosa kalamazoonensis]|uniref:TonB-dependent receptor n=1 Tax=Gemmatirosa kalamazoonensis TaxID=861299 RepID=W0REF5_9BACT|nr:TonB-dependent receptor [Gemmatirosa kalamazoonensis]AHG89494.1 TonB-dependent receptor [Gemmatirosa kalamazoonensis]
MSPLLRRAPALCVALLVPAAPLVAQAPVAVRGTVTTAEHHTPLASARVAVESPARVAVTDAAGGYVLRDLPTGRYELLVTALGYRPVRRTIQVVRGQPATLDVALETGSLLLSSVVTTATRTPVEANRVASTVNVLTPEQIRTTPARETQDLLREIPGVELPRTSSLVGGTAQIVSIRGVDEGRTAVLFDGIPVNDAWGEWIDWGRVPMRLLDRVEVVEGGTSSLYGNGAMGGVISFYSRPLSPGAASVTVEGGSRDARHVFASAGIPIAGALTANVSGDYQSGGGYRLIGPGSTTVVTNGVASQVPSTSPGAIDQRSEIVQRNLHVRLNYAPSARLSAFVTGHGYGDNRIAGTALNYQTRDMKELNAGLDVGAYATGLLTVRAWDGRQDEHQRSTAPRANSGTCAVPSSLPRQCEDSNVVADIPSHDWGASAMWTRTNLFGLESFSVGGDYRHYNGNFDEVDFNTTCPGASCGRVTRTILSGGDQSLSGAFVQAIAAPVATLRVELSARVDGWTNDNGRSVDAAAGTVSYPNRTRAAFSPRVGVRWQALPALSLHTAAYRAFRAPNLAELYRKQISPTQITLPNPELAPETALGREVGLDWQPAAWVQLKGTAYVADYYDFNVPTTISTSGGVTTRQRLNVNAVRSRGAEAYLAVRPIQALFVSGSASYDDARQQTNIADPDHKPHVNRVPSPKQTIRATYTSPLLGAWTGIWRHEGKTTTLQGVPLEPFSVLDANVQREIVRGVTGFVSVENITDEQYQINLSGAGTAALISYGLPRTVRAGVTLERR